ncbi:hypothetical protein J31TS6_10540 [Brevibacillus reuszeri]|uniref:hypothetical protein n=1 Tax=Brevibacillus reuszeri TaxID=54915 RepID=UPI001B0A5B5C|nr:hypothetical protein [Brevibacillus reuszeri]GIO05026.1 hypothetical protein J31TS6_10540 [Brevibacillus reuszeri]
MPLSSDATIKVRIGNMFSYINFNEPLTIWVSYDYGPVTTTQLRSSLQTNDAGATFKIVPVNMVITTETEFNDSDEAPETAPVLDGSSGTSFVKVVVKAANGELETYVVKKNVL